MYIHSFGSPTQGQTKNGQKRDKARVKMEKIFYVLFQGYVSLRQFLAANSSNKHKK